MIKIFLMKPEDYHLVHSLLDNIEDSDDPECKYDENISDLVNNIREILERMNEDYDMRKEN